MLQTDHGRFIALCVVLYMFLSVQANSIYVGLGLMPIVLIVGIVFGAATLWLFERVYLFVYGIARPDNPKPRFKRTVRRHLSLAIVIGTPIYLLYPGI